MDDGIAGSLCMRKISETYLSCNMLSAVMRITLHYSRAASVRDRCHDDLADLI